MKLNVWKLLRDSWRYCCVTIRLNFDGNSLDIMGRFETFYHWDLGAWRGRADQFSTLYFGAGAGGLGEWYLAGLCWHLYCAHSCSNFRMAVLAFWANFSEDEKYFIVKISLELVVCVVLAVNTNVFCLHHTSRPVEARCHTETKTGEMTAS